MHALLGDVKPDEKAIEQIRSRGGRWAVYQNVAFDSSGLGRLKFLQYGNGCTFVQPPEKLPDTATEINWMYQHVGYIDVDKGEIVEKEPST